MKAHKRKGRLGSEDGYTLVELLVVLGIIALLAGLIAPQVIGYLGRARVDTAKVQLENVVSALDLYYLDVGTYPTTEQGLSLLWEAPASDDSWRGPYLKVKEDLLDPWGRAYHYRYPGENEEYDLYTLGADNAEGGEGDKQDITN